MGRQIHHRVTPPTLQNLTDRIGIEQVDYLRSGPVLGQPRRLLRRARHRDHLMARRQKPGQGSSTEHAGRAGHEQPHDSNLQMGAHV
jgi:hypothetical protein